jgi:PKD repeat protein
MNAHCQRSSKLGRSSGRRAFWRIAAIYFLLITGLCAQTYDDYVILIDTSGPREDRAFRAQLLVGLDNFAATIPADAASRIWLLTYDEGLKRQEPPFVLGDAGQKTKFQEKLAGMPGPTGAKAWTWTALKDALGRLSTDARDSRTMSIHLFVDGAASDPKTTFAQAFAQFGTMRRAHPNLRLYYHAIAFEPPAEIVNAATPESGLTVLHGLEMPPHILRDQVLPAGTTFLSGQPHEWTGAAVGSVKNWQWDFGDGHKSSGVNPTTHTYAKSGKYKLMLTASNSAGEDHAEFDLEVRSGPPKADFSFDGVYAGTATVFHDSSQGEIERREWTIEGKPAGEGPELKHVFTGPGKFPVVLTVTGPGGSDSASKEVVILPQIKAQFSWAPQNPVAEARVAFINESTGVNEPWAWDFGDGGSSTERNPQHTYARPGKYTVALTARGPAGAVNFSLEVAVVEPQWKIVVTPQPAWQGKPASFQVDGLPSNDLQVTWDFGDGKPLVVPGGNAAEHTYAKPGDYVVRAQVASIHGNGRDWQAVPQAKVSVQAEEVALAFTAKAGRSLATGPRALRGPVPLELTIENLTTGPIARYAWDFGDGKTSDDRLPSPHTYTRPGVYRVSLQVVDQFQRKYSTTGSEQFEIQATGWRPLRDWRWGYAILLFLLAYFVWRTCLPRFAWARWKEEGAAASKETQNWGKLLRVGPRGSQVTLRLVSDLWLRKSFFLAKTDRPLGHTRRTGTPVTDGRVKKGDKITPGGGRTLEIVRLNDRPITGLTAQLILLLGTAAVLWFTWQLFV